MDVARLATDTATESARGVIILRLALTALLTMDAKTGAVLLMLASVALATVCTGATYPVWKSASKLMRLTRLWSESAARRPRACAPVSAVADAMSVLKRGTAQAC